MYKPQICVLDFHKYLQLSMLILMNTVYFSKRKDLEKNCDGKHVFSVNDKHFKGARTAL